MLEQIQMKKCNKCNSELIGHFCSNCGHPQELKRINRQFILSEIGSVLNFQKGIFFTVKELLISPGANIKKYISEDRNRLVKPISFIILSSLIYTILQQLLKFEDGYMNYSGLNWGDSAVLTIMKWIGNNYGFANILMANFMALWIKLFFKKYQYNYFEILILLYFVLGVQMLMFSILGSLESIIGIKILDNGGVIVTVIYVCWAIGQFFDSKKTSNYIKALLSYLLGLLSFIFIAAICGLLIDFIIK